MKWHWLPSDHHKDKQIMKATNLHLIKSRTPNLCRSRMTKKLGRGECLGGTVWRLELLNRQTEEEILGLGDSLRSWGVHLNCKNIIFL